MVELNKQSYANKYISMAQKSRVDPKYEKPMPRKQSQDIKVDTIKGE
jgi:hypothetical protein